MALLSFSQLPPRTYVTCPRCGSPHAIITLERVDTQSCFCPRCQQLWQTALTRSRPEPQ
jgi:uncharacterized paraquat-inducible protein A